LTELPGGYDLILANLTRNDLVALAREMAEKSSPDGRLILSGVLDEQVPDVLEAFQTEGFEKTLHLGRDEWAALALARRKTSSESEESDDPAAPDVRSSKNFDELPNPSGEPRDAENREDEDGR
jgi:hypothetical protein